MFLQTRRKSDIPNLVVNRYELITSFTRDDPRVKRLGGVGIFIKRGVSQNTKIIDVTKFCEEEILEVAACEVTIATCSFFLGNSSGDISRDFSLLYKRTMQNPNKEVQYAVEE